MSEQTKSAIIRGAYNAAGTFFVTFLGMLSIVSVSKAAIAGGIAALGVLGFRGVGEGVVDTSRALQVAQGKAQPAPSDIQAKPQPVFSYNPSTGISGPVNFHPPINVVTDSMHGSVKEGFEGKFSIPNPLQEKHEVPEEHRQ